MGKYSVQLEDKEKYAALAICEFASLFASFCSSNLTDGALIRVAATA